MDTNELIEFLNNFQAGDVVKFGIIIIGIITAFVALCKKLYVFIEDYRIKKNKEEASRQELDDMATRLDKLCRDISSMMVILEQSKINDRQIIRCQILEMYHETKRKGYILELDKIQFDDLVSCYHVLGGNSFVNDTIIPYMSNVDVIESSDDVKDNTSNSSQ